MERLWDLSIISFDDNNYQPIFDFTHIDQHLHTNDHPMITRVKVGGFKPETYIVFVYDNETMSLKFVLSFSLWFQAMKD